MDSQYTDNIDYSRKWLVMSALGMGIFLATIDGSIVNVALPTLVTQFNARFEVVQWVVLGYLLTLATLMLSIGRLADMVGKKPIYLTGMIIFTFGSLMCGLSQTVYWLIGFRIFQAIGAAMMMAHAEHRFEQKSVVWDGRQERAKYVETRMAVLTTMTVGQTAICRDRQMVVQKHAWPQSQFGPLDGVRAYPEFPEQEDCYAVDHPMAGAVEPAYRGAKPAVFADDRATRAGQAALFRHHLQPSDRQK